MIVKKIILVFALTIAILATGCSNGGTKIPQTTAAAETATSNTDIQTAPPATEEDKIEPQPTEAPIPETTQEVQTEPPATENNLAYSDYMASIKAQSDAIKHALANDTLTQTEMNEKSQELYVLWDNALNNLWGELQKHLPEEDFSKLLDEQLVWIEEKEQTVADAGKEFEGGSIYSMIVNGEAAKITEERVYEFYEMLNP